MCRWYRAIELLYGAREYDAKVDIWGAAMVLAELLGHGPLIPGVSDIDQLARVIRLLGSVDRAAWPEAEKLPDFHKIRFPDCKPRWVERRWACAIVWRAMLMAPAAHSSKAPVRAAPGCAAECPRPDWQNAGLQPQEAFVGP